jgi:hypothetical protein
MKKFNNNFKPISKFFSDDYIQTFLGDNIYEFNFLFNDIILISVKNENGKDFLPTVLL